MAKTLFELLVGVSPAQKLDPGILQLPVESVTADSREVRTGTLFVAIQGESQDGHRFIADAQVRGAVVIIGQIQAPESCKVPYFQVADSRAALAQIAANWHGNPSHQLLVAGVTGTSGKTTTTYLIESVLKAAGHRVGVIGTVNYRFEATVLPSTHTTPSALELQGILAEMKSRGCTAVVMEVSSHALKQKRVACLAFDVAVFSNLSPEHLDYHPDMEDYFQSKALLFDGIFKYSIDHGKNPVAVVNEDDPYGKRLIGGFNRAHLGTALSCISYGLGGSAISGAGLDVRLSGIRGRVGDLEIQSRLSGQFNAYNLLAAIGVGKGLNLHSDTISKGIAFLEKVPGRLESVPNSRGIHLLVDYAHKPDALEKVLTALRELRGTNRLITVFGCGGDRDRKKRSVMGKLAVTLSDFVWITSDNPRTEDPNAIIAQIVAGTSGYSNFRVEADRRAAIFGAVKMARPGDIIVIAGKGHEDYQIIRDDTQPGRVRKIHSDDREIALDALAMILDRPF